MNILSYLIKPHGDFPNNDRLPVMLYKQALQSCQPEDIEQQLIANGWKNSWQDSIYPYHHYHSNTHEVLAIYSGSCDVQLGGDEGQRITVERGDVLIIPAGVAHKNIQSTDNFKCMGSYPEEIEYDMYYGKPGERSQTDSRISEIPLPQSDPIYGKQGVLFEYWK